MRIFVGGDRTGLVHQLERPSCSQRDSFLDLNAMVVHWNRVFHQRGRVAGDCAKPSVSNVRARCANSSRGVGR